MLVKSHGVKKARIQVLDLEQDPSKFWKSDNMFGEDVNVVKKKEKMVEIIVIMIKRKIPTGKNLIKYQKI